MKKDVYTILVNRLDKAGYVYKGDSKVSDHESIIIAGQFALSKRLGAGMEVSFGYTEELAAKLKLSFDQLDVILAILKEDDDIVSISSITSKYACGSDYVRNACAGLKNKGYLNYVDGSPFRPSGFCVTTPGLMSLFAEQPLDKLDMNMFDKLESEEKAALPDNLDPISINSPFGEFPHGIQESRPKAPSVKFDKSFLEFLAEQVNVFCKGRQSLDHLVSLVDKCLNCAQNKRFFESFDTIGYFKHTDGQKAFLLLLCNHFVGNGISPMDFSKRSAPVDTSSSSFKELQSAARVLVTEGLVVIPPDDAYANNKDEIVKERYMLSPDVAGTVFHGMTQFIDYSSLCRQADVWKSEGIEPKDLLFDGEISEKVSSLHKLMDPESSPALMKRLGEVGRKSLTCLFYGAPGVGKTELCKQLARSTGRDCIVADPAKLNGSYWGDTEKNTREIFRAYKYLYKISDNAPILVLNEADGIISKRFTKVHRATEKSENAVQGIILQELETFEGVCIATTNLQDNLDAAVDRRFLYKIRFDYPSEQIRKQIICMKMKWISEDDARALSHEFCLSGGQIDNLASKCIIEKFVTGQEASLDKMRSFCCEEISMRSENTRPQSVIGFIRYPQMGIEKTLDA